MEILDGFGITLVCSDCAFTAELQRESIGRMMKEIDSHLTEQGAPDDAGSRINVMMDNASALSLMIANGEIEHDEGVADIAYSTIYALGKRIGFDQIVRLRGLTGTLLHNTLSINPCLGDLEYQSESASLQRAMAALETTGHWDIENTSHTVH